jgi:hypothetical protein
MAEEENKRFNEFLNKHKNRKISSTDYDEFFTNLVTSKPNANQNIHPSKMSKEEDLAEQRRKANETLQRFGGISKGVQIRTNMTEKVQKKSIDSSIFHPNTEPSEEIKRPVEEVPDKILNIKYSSNLGRLLLVIWCIEVDRSLREKFQDKESLKNRPRTNATFITVRELLSVLEEMNMVNSRHYFKALQLLDM